MEISLEKYEEMQDRIAQLEKENEELMEAVSCQPNWMHWISVKDRVPESGIGVLVFTDDYCAYTAHYDGYWWLSGEPTLSYDVTHWMPLPAPPEVEDVQG